MNEPATSWAVSYTHLDVYKRQAAIKSVDKPSTTDRDSATGLINYGFDASGNLYFKGDVYKRQE